MSILTNLTCPARRLRRFSRQRPRELHDQPGPWSREANLDTWSTDRWTTNRRAAERSRRAFMRRNPSGSISKTADEWLWPWGPPRVCSFCGAVHPEDAIRLRREGWEVEICDNPGKAYLNPPGTRARRDAILSQMREDGPEVDWERVPDVWSPVPPVIVRGYHFTAKSLQEFNDAGQQH